MDGGTSTDEAIAIMRRDKGDKWADILDYYIKNFRDSLTGIVPGARVLVNDLKAAGIGRVGPEQLGIQSVPRGRGTVRYFAAA